jgi:starch synthase (maltosyl-transferring)
MAQTNPPIIYNIFPRNYRTIDEWHEDIPHIAAMNFNWIFVNPVHETGSSGSLYSIKDYYRLNPLFLDKNADPSDWKPVKKFISACKAKGMDVIADLVINHTATDSVLVPQYPAWYRHESDGKLYNPRVVDPSDSNNVTIWRDLAEIDNNCSVDKEDLWIYWDNLVAFLQEIGFAGFRCDAAYMVCAPLWNRIIRHAKKRDDKVIFLAETLGCSIGEVNALRDAHFDYLFNSSKWWNFDASWCLDQHESMQSIAPSISFAESHDTVRLASDWPGSAAMQKSRYLFASLFSKGLLMTTGYEFGAKIKLDVVRGTSGSIEPQQWDLSGWIADVNKLKTTTPVLGCEGHWRLLSQEYSREVIFFEKRSDNGSDQILVCINKSKDQKRWARSEDFPHEIDKCGSMLRPVISFDKQKVQKNFELEAGECVLFW